MTDFTKEDIDILKALVDTLIAMTPLEPNETRAVNKLYSFFVEQER